MSAMGRCKSESDATPKLKMSAKFASIGMPRSGSSSFGSGSNSSNFSGSFFGGSSAMTRRSSVTSVSDQARISIISRDGTLRESAGHEDTLTSLFMSGNAAEVLPPRRSIEEAQFMRSLRSLDGGRVSNRGSLRNSNRISSCSGGSESLVASSAEVEDGPEVTFFPDPPCILPFQESGDEDASEAMNKQTDEMNWVQDYWKTHAGVDARCFPEAELHRKANELFNEEWVTLDESRHGEFQAYVSIARHALGIRNKPGLQDQFKSGRVVEPGASVVVQSITEKDNIRFLQLTEAQGWLFEHTRDSQELIPVMAELKHVEVGLWWHRVVCQEFLYVRSTPVHDPEVRTKYVLSPGELVLVDLKCQVRGWKFVRLADGRGWVFVMRPGIRKDNTEIANTCVRDVDEEILHGSAKVDFRTLLPPTNKAVEVGQWTYVVMQAPVLCIGSKRFGTYLVPGDIVKVDKRAYSEGDEPCPHDNQVRWLHLKDERGWVPEAEDGEVLLQLRERNLSHPAWYKGYQNLDDAAEELVGFV